MKRKLIRYTSLSLFLLLGLLFSTHEESSLQKAIDYPLNRTATLQFDRSSYHLKFNYLNELDEMKIDSELQKIHQIDHKITKSVFSHSGNIILTLAKTIDDQLVLVMFKNQQVQMIQRIKKLDDQVIEFQYGQIVFSQNPEKMALSMPSNIEI